MEVIIITNKEQLAQMTTLWFGITPINCYWIEIFLSEKLVWWRKQSRAKMSCHNV